MSVRAGDKAIFRELGNYRTGSEVEITSAGEFVIKVKFEDGFTCYARPWSLEPISKEKGLENTN